ncbi:hypothetical protein BSLG_005658 [Batrachochytrium salamandrivorans]|nr:hypothetical protein BSLG_005658 [Batrachochytrium salamandrivorans]
MLVQLTLTSLSPHKKWMKTERFPNSGEFIELFMKCRQGLTFLVQHSSSENDQLICERMISQSIMKGILIYKKSLTPSANKVVQEMAPKYQLELFQESELLVNITQHTLVPVHEVLTVDEKKTLLAR